MSDEQGRERERLRLHHRWFGDEDSPRPPLLLIHGGGSTIESNWGMLLPHLCSTRTVLAVELQGHGRTASGDGPASFEGSADDVAALLAELGVGPVDVLGFSNGGQVALLLAARHPERVRRLIAASAPFRRDGMIEGFWEGLAAGTFDDLPDVYRSADLAVSHDPGHARRMFELDQELMLGFQGFEEAVIASITAPTLVVGGDRDVVRADHFVELAGLLPDARLLIVPGGHGDYLGEVLAAGGDPRAMEATLPFLLAFLDA
ncbi:alpha/beta fold hydrolase [Leifsonia sp. F6_8S_P_1B]|uniref:Alpha/beta fold hydrolase n=1 Tax=Leifsonia williamsii TaxID=3035919 RepID=A0ABT8K7D4_9MICO|nr:alpha/beta fold hydrolase [Leifsonia williamsii]MDN4613344.1 alpha/beta fold hydrolase [Leifsonia williamsii]